MAYQISITEAAKSQLLSLPTRDQRIIQSAVVSQLTNQPTVETNAIKRLRPNPVAEFELRIGDFRVLYKVHDDRAEVVVLVIGQKVRNALIVSGREFHEHKSDPPQGTGNGSPRGAQ